MKLIHGGNLEIAEKTFGIRKSDWLDLSTGINPHSWPVPNLPDEVWRRLPALDEELKDTAEKYYQCDSLLPIPGSQFAISLLPTLFPQTTVALPVLGYQEHQHAWSQAKHKIVLYPNNKLTELENQILKNTVNIVIVINPNNPSCDVIEQTRLTKWLQMLAKNNGYLIIDETFMDSMPELSMAKSLPSQHLIILRSIGKFFGLAGIRLGFVLAENDMLSKIKRHVDPWAVNGPAQWIAIQALSDKEWQNKNRQCLHAQSHKMLTYLQEKFSGILIGIAHTSLFISITIDKHIAQQLYQALAKRGILVRLIPFTEEHGLIRFGLIADDHQWDKFCLAIDAVKLELNL